MSELKPCPFCGGEASSTGRICYSEKHDARWPDGSRIREAFFVNCMKCSCDNKGFIGHRTTAEAIAAWNRRPDAPRADTGWMPIETARKAEPEVLLYCPGEGMTTGFYVSSKQFTGWTTGWVTAGGYDVGYNEIRPTHWRPLPAPPQADGAQG